MNYAIIKNEIVTNVIWLSPENANEFPDAVPMNDIPAIIGDSYIDGVFYRNGEKVLTVVEEAIAVLEAAAEAYWEGVNEA